MTKTDYLKAATNEKIPKIKVGDYYKYADIWVVTVNERVFCRQASKNNKGWYSAIIDNPQATVKFNDLEFIVAGKPPSDHKVLAEEINKAYINKYGRSFSWLSIVARLMTRKKHVNKTIELIFNQ